MSLVESALATAVATTPTSDEATRRRGRAGHLPPGSKRQRRPVRRRIFVAGAAQPLSLLAMMILLLPALERMRLPPLPAGRGGGRVRVGCRRGGSRSRTSGLYNNAEFEVSSRSLWTTDAAASFSSPSGCAQPAGPLSFFTSVSSLSTANAAFPTFIGEPTTPRPCASSPALVPPSAHAASLLPRAPLKPQVPALGLGCVKRAGVGGW